jgi:hypothetical protein
VGASALRNNVVGTNNTAVGFSALYANTGVANVAVGGEALRYNTTAGDNVAVGYSALWTNTTGAGNTAVGSRALNLNTAGNNAAVGSYALYANTAGASNVAVGAETGYAPGGVAANATKLGGNNTFIGFRSGAANATDPSYTTAIGRYALVAGNYSTALGCATQAKAAGAVAIGVDNTGTGAIATTANEFVLGTALHRYRMPGLPMSNPGAGTGILWNNAGVVTVA